MQLQQASQQTRQQASQGHAESSTSQETLHEMKELNKRLRTMQEQQLRHPMATVSASQHYRYAHSGKYTANLMWFAISCSMRGLDITWCLVDACTTFLVWCRAC